MLRFERIQHLMSPEELRLKTVVQVGVGSGGAAANDHLTMNGVRKWVLFDPDTYEDVNLVKHPRTRSSVGGLKVKNQEAWILDRNPASEVSTFAEDVVQSQHFPAAVRGADLILCCADKPEVRSFVNSIAVEARTPCVTASVFRQGFGGEVYAYVPGETGCFECMTRTADEQGWNIEESIEPSPHEQETIYGLNLRDFKASGLSMDIQAIAIILARAGLEILLKGTNHNFTPLPSNWVIFYNRPIPNNPLSGFLKAVHLRVKARKDCRCSGA